MAVDRRLLWWGGGAIRSSALVASDQGWSESLHPNPPKVEFFRVGVAFWLGVAGRCAEPQSPGSRPGLLCL